MSRVYIKKIYDILVTEAERKGTDSALFKERKEYLAEAAAKGGGSKTSRAVICHAYDEYKADENPESRKKFLKQLVNFLLDTKCKYAKVFNKKLADDDDDENETLDEYSGLTKIPPMLAVYSKAEPETYIRNLYMKCFPDREVPDAVDECLSQIRDEDVDSALEAFDQTDELFNDIREVFVWYMITEIPEVSERGLDRMIAASDKRIAQLLALQKKEKQNGDTKALKTTNRLLAKEKKHNPKLKERREKKNARIRDGDTMRQIETFLENENFPDADIDRGSKCRRRIEAALNVISNAGDEYEPDAVYPVYADSDTGCGIYLAGTDFFDEGNDGKSLGIAVLTFEPDEDAYRGIAFCNTDEMRIGDFKSADDVESYFRGACEASHDSFVDQIGIDNIPDIAIFDEDDFDSLYEGYVSETLEDDFNNLGTDLREPETA